MHLFTQTACKCNCHSWSRYYTEFGADLLSASFMKRRPPFELALTVNVIFVFAPPGIKAESALVAVQRPNISRSITFQISYVCKYVRIRFLGCIREETLDELDPLRLLRRIQRANLNSPPPIHPSVDCAGPELVC